MRQWKWQTFEENFIDRVVIGIEAIVQRRWWKTEVIVESIEVIDELRFDDPDFRKNIKIAKYKAEQLVSARNDQVRKGKGKVFK